jgi:hypothetical protein
MVWMRAGRQLVEGAWQILRFEVTLREGPAKAGFQVALEAEGGLLVSKLDNDGKSCASLLGAEMLDCCREAVDATQFLRRIRTERLADPAYFALDLPVKIAIRLSACGEGPASGPPSRLRRYAAASFAWLVEPKLTLRRKLA